MRVRWMMIGIVAAVVTLAVIMVASIQPGPPLASESAASVPEGFAEPEFTRATQSSGHEANSEMDSRTPAHAAASQEPVHIPDYGPDLAPSDASVTFALVDALGAAVEFSNDFQVRLFRKQGRYWLTCPTPWPSAGRLACGGLEPGEYELEYACEFWGSARHRFVVAKSEQRTEHLRMDTWRRVICFKFEHPDGTPVSHVRRKPKVSRKHAVLDAVNRDEPNLDFLSRGPRESRKGIRFVERARRGGYWSEPEVYPTDEGRFYVQVMAGMPNVVEFELETETWGTQALRFEDDFTGEQWDPYVVKLQTPADFAQRIAARGEATTSSRGCRYLVAPERDWLEERLAEAPSEGRTRLLLNLQCDPDVVPVIDPTYEKGGAHMWKLPDGRWWHDVIASRPSGLKFTDHRYFCTTGESIQLGDQPVVELARTVKPRYLVLELAEWKHTLANRFQQVELRIQADDKPLYEEGPRDAIGEDPADHPDEEAVDGSGDTIVYISSNGYYAHPPRYPMPADGILRVPFDGEVLEHAANWRQLSFHIGPIDGPATQSATIHFERGGALEAIAKPIRLEPCRRLAYRAVGPAGEGLPCVCGLVMEADQDALARATRECCLRRDPPPFLHVASIDEHRARLEQLTNAANPALLREMLGDDTWSAFDNDAQRLWFARNACWYDFRSRVHGDEHGYLLADWPLLAPGKRYVLYLWSRSRDDLRPDSRIVFEAGAGITDLGVIRLPAHTD